MHEIIYLPEVWDDLDSAYDWYEKENFGEIFREDHNKSRDRLLINPNSRQIIFDDDVRRFGLNKFESYGIFYSFKNNVVVVYAVFHSSQDPDKLFERIINH